MATQELVTIWALCTLNSDLLVSIDGELFSESGVYLDTIGRRRKISTGLIPGGYKDKYLRTKTGMIGERYMHRIVGDIFIPNPKRKPQINHKNKIENDNRVENLEWVTSKENQQHAYKSIKIVVKDGKRIYSER